jgi:hypothetical protein
LSRSIGLGWKRSSPGSFQRIAPSTAGALSCNLLREQIVERASVGAVSEPSKMHRKSSPPPIILPCAWRGKNAFSESRLITNREGSAAACQLTTADSRYPFTFNSINESRPASAPKNSLEFLRVDFFLRFFLSLSITQLTSADGDQQVERGVYAFLHMSEAIFVCCRVEFLGLFELIYKKRLRLVNCVHFGGQLRLCSRRAGLGRVIEQLI